MDQEIPIFPLRFVRREGILAAMRTTLALSLLMAALGVSSLCGDTQEPFLIDSMPTLAPDTRRETL